MGMQTMNLEMGILELLRASLRQNYPMVKQFKTIKK
jgi:hypothetical protein